MYAILNFYKRLEPDFGLPDNIKIMNPFRGSGCLELASKFYNKFYNDLASKNFNIWYKSRKIWRRNYRHSITDPIALQEKCGNTKRFA